MSDVEAGPTVDLRIGLLVVGEDRVVAARADEPIEAGAADHRVVVPAAREDVVTVAALEGVDPFLPTELVVPRAAVDRVGLGASAQERLVSRPACQHDRPEEVEPGATLAASIEVVVAAEQVNLEVEGAGGERHVDVAVAARREAVLARRHVVGAVRPVDHPLVAGIAEGGRDLDLGDVRLGRRSGAEESFALVERQLLVRPSGAGDRDGIRVRRRRAPPRRRECAEADLASGNVEDGGATRCDRRADRPGDGSNVQDSARASPGRRDQASR